MTKRGREPLRLTSSVPREKSARPPGTTTATSPTQTARRRRFSIPVWTCPTVSSGQSLRDTPHPHGRGRRRSRPRLGAGTAAPIPPMPARRRSQLGRAKVAVARVLAVLTAIKKTTAGWPRQSPLRPADRARAAFALSPSCRRTVQQSPVLLPGDRSRPPGGSATSSGWSGAWRSTVERSSRFRGRQQLRLQLLPAGHPGHP